MKSRDLSVTSTPNVRHILERSRVALRRISGLVLLRTIRSAAKISCDVAKSFPNALWPVVNSQEQLADIVARIEWAVPDMQPKRPVVVPLHESLRGIVWDRIPSTPYLARPKYSNISFQPEYDASRFKSLLQKSSIVLVWDASSLISGRLLTSLARLAVIDPSFYFLVEYAGWGKLLDCTVAPDLVRDLECESKINFQALMERASRRRVVNVFGRGPSLVDAYRHPLDEQCNIICNGIVRSRTLLKHLRPLAVTFVDAIHYLGPSRYAARFREDMVRAVIDFDMFVVVPDDHVYLLAVHHPEIRARLIGLKRAQEISVPSPSLPRVMPQDNILTHIMLPLALSLKPDVVQIWGCDGRSPEKSVKFVWERESSVEYEELADTAAAAHPSYFRDFVQEDYYRLHCSQLAEWMCFAESQGVQVRSCTKSYIQSLRDRSSECFSNDYQPGP